MEIGAEDSVSSAPGNLVVEFSADCLLALEIDVVDDVGVIEALRLLPFPFIDALLGCSINSLSFLDDDGAATIADLLLDLPAYDPTGIEPLGQIHPRLP